MNQHIRWLIRRDMPEVLAIESASFADPWDEEHFLHHLRQRNCIGMVAEDKDERIIGYFVYALLKSKLHLLNLAVHPGYRRQGVGRAMVERLRGKIVGHRMRTHVSADVIETNLDAHLFLRAVGFRATCIVKDLYETTDADAYRFVMRAQPITTDAVSVGKTAK